MAQRAAMRQITSVTDVADLPYRTVEPILRRIDNPAQLREIEKNCPQIAEQSGDLWQALIRRDVSNADQKMMYPKDPRSWWKVYRKMMKEEQAAKEEAEEQLRRAMQGIKEEKKGGETRIINAVLPTGKASKGRAQFIDGVRNTGTPRIPSEKTDALKAIQRASAAARANIFKPRVQPGKVRIPPARSQIRHTPKSMGLSDEKISAAAARAAAEVRKYVEPKSELQRSQKVFAPQLGKKSAADRAIEEARWKAQQQREERLRALTGNATKPRPAATATAASASTPATSPPAAAARLSPPKSTASPQRRAAPSPAPTGSPAPAPAGMKRKRPAADPFMPMKKGRP